MTSTAQATPTNGASGAVAPAQGTAVWQAVAQGVTQTISPLLKPTVLPAGIATVQLLSVQPGAFQVEYCGPGKRLRISVGQLSPPPGVGEVPLLVRGQHVALVLHPPDSPDGSDWLTWQEPGRWLPPDGRPAEPFVEYFVFANGLSPAEVQQVLASLTPVAPPLPSATLGNGNATAAPSLDTAIGGIALGVNGATVLRVLGQPAVRTVANGMGTPEWQYADGLTVQLTDRHNPARPDTVWEISAQLPFAGATATGFRLGDSEAQCRKAYQGLRITAPQVRQLQIEAADGTLLGVLFDPNGKATMLTFSSQWILRPNYDRTTRSPTMARQRSGRENGTP